MILRRLALPLCALVLCGADQPPPPPAALAPYIENGELRPGDYRWFKGRFADAGEQDKADLRAIDLWMSQCLEQSKAEARQQLAALGFPDAKLDSAVVGPLLCRVALFRPNLTDTGSYAAFAAEVEVATPIAETFLFAVHQAEAGTLEASELREALRLRPVGEQMLRRGLSWGQGMGEGAPELTPAGREIVRSRLWAATAARDEANTLWLKDIVAKQGWPRISAVGEKAAGEAWLLVQHADHDPVFQFQALRLMEPLVAERDVSPRNYAYLYDRVMLKLAGTQRYGTQFMCVDGKWAPQSLEDSAAVDRFRQEAGMETQAENTARIQESYGTCR